MSNTPDDQLQATEQEGSVHRSQQAEQQDVNTADQFSKTEITEGSKNEQPVQVEQQNSHLQQAHPEIQLQQAETEAESNSFQLAEKETGSFGQQSFAGAKVDVTQPSVVQQNVKQTVGQQASSGAQDTRKGPSIPFNMLIPILQAHLDRDKDMQLQAVWAKLRRNEVHKDDFLRVIRNIVGDQMLKQAAHKVFVQMQAQAQRNSQANPSQQSLFSQVSAQQMSSSGSAQLHDQKLRPTGPPNQGQKNQVSSSHQAFAPPSGTQAQNSGHYLAHDNPNQNPDAKGTNVVPNQPPRMNAAVPLQTKNKQHQPTQLQQVPQQIYGASNPGAQACKYEEKGLTCKVAAKERIKARGWKAKCKRARHLRSQARTSLAGVESVRDAALEREMSLQQELSAAALRESTLQSELAVARGDLEFRANTMTGLLRDLQDVTRARAACVQRLHEMEANYAALREEFHHVYYTLYPYVPPATPDETAAPAADAPAALDAPAGAAPGAAAGSSADAPGDDDDGDRG